MKARVCNIKNVIFSFFIIISFPCGQTHLTKDTDWISDKLLIETVIIDKGATLTINNGVKVRIKFVDTNADNLGDIKLIVLGRLKIEGTPSEPVIFEPADPTSNRNYWAGIIINSSVSNNSLVFFNVNNASIGIDINSPVLIKGMATKNTGEIGIKVNPVSGGSVIFSDVIVRNSAGHGVIINSPDVAINWMHIDSCLVYGLVSRSLSVISASNLKISNSSNTGLVNYGDISITNAIIEKNRHGITSFSGNLDLQESSIVNNGVNGLLLGGDSKNTITYTSIENNGGYGIETTKWAQGGLNGPWSQSSDPLLLVHNCNIRTNHQTIVMDHTMYDGLWDDWIGEKYSGDGWISGWNAILVKSIPFGRIGWISFDYNSNNGGNDFSWQPCTGNSVWSYLVELRDSRDQKLTYLSAPFQCYWNPLGGENSNTWHSYENLTGLINKTNNYTNWHIDAQDIPNSDSYSIWQYFEYAYVPLLGTEEYAIPEIKNIKLKFYHGGYEVSSYSDNEIIDLSLNYWGQKMGIDTLFNPYGTGPINYSDFRISEIDSAYSSLNKTSKILFVNPIVRSSHEEVKTLNLTWKTNGWIPLIDIVVSTDMGKSWSYIAEKIANTGSYEWWNNLITGETFYLRIDHSNKKSVTTKIGPLYVIENITPIIDVSTKTLDFKSKFKSLKFNILNEGGGSLSWTVTDNRKWLSLSRNSGTTNNQSVITVSVNRTGLKAGNYTGIILIASNARDISIKVRMAINKPDISLSTESLDFDSTKTEMSFSVVNRGGGYIKWKAEPDSNWIILNTKSGTALTRAIVTVKVDRSQLDDGVQTGSIRIGSNAGDSSIKVSITQLADKFDKKALSDIPYYIHYPCGKDLFDYTVY